MLNIFNLLKKIKLIRTFDITGQSTRKHIRDLPAVKNWLNSVYAFNKSSTRFLPAVHHHVFILLKSYFNMTYKNLEYRLPYRTNRIPRRVSGRKVWVSAPEIKHLPDRVNITVYAYDRVYNTYKKKLALSRNFSSFVHKSASISKFNDFEYLTLDNDINQLILRIDSVETVLERLKIYISSVEQGIHIPDLSIIKLIHILKYALEDDANWCDELITKQECLYPKEAKRVKSVPANYVKIIKRLKADKLTILQDLLSDTSVDNKVLDYLKAQRYDYLIKSFKMELIYLRFAQKKLFQEFKYKELYLVPLINLLEDIYRKKIEFNIVSLKYNYLSSSILSQIVVKKLKTPKNRGKSLRPLDNALAQITVPALSGNKIQRLEIEYTGMQNVILSKENGSLNEFLKINKISNSWSGKDIDSLVLKNLENKGIAGIFIKISGRLTKRYKAERAISSLRYRGTLKNVYSSYSAFSSSTLRGHDNINIDKTILHSKIKIGAFGLKGWVSSH